MAPVLAAVREVWHECDATAMVEYAFLLALVVIVTLAAWSALGSAVADTVMDMALELPGGCAS